MTRPASSSSRELWSAEDLASDPHLAADKPERVRSMFSAIASSYDLNNRLHSFGRDQAWRRTAVTRADVRLEDDVLDVACGTGDLAEAFATARPASVTGLDFAEPMLEIARRKASRRPRHAGAPTPLYVQGDAMSLPFADASFDVVSIAFGIRNVADPRRAVLEFQRVLRPQGRLVILEFGRPHSRVLRFLNDVYTKVVMPRTASLVARDRTGAYRYLPRSIETFLDSDAMRKLLEETGFEDVSAHAMTFGVFVAYRARVGRKVPGEA